MRKRRSTFPYVDLLASAENANLRLLVKWLAQPYGDNSPIFATELPDGRPLETGAMMASLYREVVGEKTPSPGEWWQCPECRTWQVRNVPS